jgi:hypothetical protein
MGFGVILIMRLVVLLSNEKTRRVIESKTLPLKKQA